MLLAILAIIVIVAGIGGYAVLRTQTQPTPEQPTRPPKQPIQPPEQPIELTIDNLLNIVEKGEANDLIGKNIRVTGVVRYTDHFSMGIDDFDYNFYFVLLGGEKGKDDKRIPMLSCSFIYLRAWRTETNLPYPKDPYEFTVHHVLSGGDRLTWKGKDLFGSQVTIEGTFSFEPIKIGVITVKMLSEGYVDWKGIEVAYLNDCKMIKVS